MPELPEVQTTVNGLRNHVVGLKIFSVWTNYNSPYFKGSKTIKDPKYFLYFKKKIVGNRITRVERRAKNILIHTSSTKNSFSEKIILIHMKMTGHLLYGKYYFNKKTKRDPWEPISPHGLKDPFNRHVHFVITFNNGHNLALSDMRKFAKVTLIDTRLLSLSEHLNNLGPEPLEKEFDFTKFKTQVLLKPHWKIKQTLMNQNVIAGIGNIYADESLWRAGIHPKELVNNISDKKLHYLYDAIIKTLKRGIDFGGDSMSDYRNVHGEKGKFQEQHNAYRRTGGGCRKHKCGGTIMRITLGGRGTHFCNKHQRLQSFRA